MSEKTDRIKKKIDKIKEEREDLKEKYNYLVEEMKKNLDANSQEISSLKSGLKKSVDAQDRLEEEFRDMSSDLDSANKSISKVENRQTALKEKLSDDLKLAEKTISSSLSGKVKSLGDQLRSEVRDKLKTESRALRETRKDVKDVLDRDKEHRESFSEMGEELENLKNMISDLSGMHNLTKAELKERVNLLEKEINSEISKVKSLEESLKKDVEDFEKFSIEQKAKSEKFESKISDKVDVFGMEKENLKRDFSSLSNDFKNLGNKLDSLKDKDAEMDQRIQNISIDLENFKKLVEETLDKLKEDHAVFKENVVAKLNEANDKIFNRLSQNEMRTSSEISRQAEEIKMFRSHVTNFINDLVDNYEKRFENMKAEIDRSLHLLDERSKEQRAMIFE